VFEIARRWRPPHAGKHWLVGVGLNLGPAAAAVGLWVVFAPESGWENAHLLAVLAAIAALASLAELRLKSAAVAFFDGSIILALVALAVAGPLPALLIWSIPAAISVLVMRRVPVLSPGVVATISSYALALLGADLVLGLADAPSASAAAPSLYTAGVLMWVVNFVFVVLTFSPFYEGFRVRSLIRSEFLDLAPAVLAMLVIGVVSAAFVPALGAFALAPLALATLVPQLAFAVLARTRSVARLSQAEATELYAAAIGDVLGLSRYERWVIDGAATMVAGWESTPPRYVNGRPRDLPALSGMVALGVDERWDGTGGPFGVHGADLPRATRVLTVARAWSALTAAGTAQLPHNEALLDLAARAGRELDPNVVEAAAQVIAEEEGLVRDPDFEPRLHRLPLPRRVRRGAIPALVARLAESPS
jgi:hypothetical protein